MRVVRIEDPARFAELATPLLLQDEPRHNLLLSICATLVERPQVYPEFHLWLAEEAGEPVAAAVLTPPFNIAISKPLHVDAIPTLARVIHSEGLNPLGVVGAVPEVKDFVDTWSDVGGRAASMVMSQRIYQLTEVRPVSGVLGRMREAARADREQLIEWVLAFSKEALPEEQVDRERTERFMDLRLEKEGGGYFVWEDGHAVSLVGYGGFTPSGARIGPVYTPSELRRKGYASALTAGVSSWLLASGRRVCFLYTDLANPTSNSIYQQIGYVPVCDSAQYRFEDPSGS
jgi:uncharacterized protein